MRSVRWTTWLGVVLALTSTLAVRAFADDKPAKSEKKPAAAQKEKTPAKKTVGEPAPAEPIPPKREAAAIQLAQQHHPELALLLNSLKASHPDQYAKALRELDKTCERLEKARENDADRAAIMLREWQLDSRVRLLAARLTMSTSEELETELRQTLADRHDVRLQLLTYDREKSKTRLQKMDEQIAEHVRNRDSSIDREVDRIKRNADVRKKSVAKPATKRGGEKETRKP